MRARSKIKAVQRLLLALSAAASASCAPVVAGEAANDVEIIDGLQKSYDAAVDFAADFRQETELKTLGRTLKAWGKVQFKRPGKMLWQYEEPKGQWVMSDGDYIYYYQPEQRQVLKSALKQAFHSDTPLSFLLGLGNLRRDFKVTVKGLEQDHYVVHLGPKGEMQGVDEVVLGVEREGYNIGWGRIRDPNGNTTLIRFSNVRRGIGVKDSLFRLQVPQGADLVEIGPK